MEQVQNMYGGEEKTWQLDRFVSLVRDRYVCVKRDMDHYDPVQRI